MKARFCFTIICAAALLLLASCKSHDDDPFADLSPTKKPPAEEKQKKSNSLLDQLDFSGSERAKRKARLRDVSRPLNDNSKEARTFPWRDAETRRSETLHESLRETDSAPVYYDW